MLILTAVITYIFFSSNSVSYLLHDSNFWGYIWKNGLFIGHVYGIDSVFTNNPFPMVVNGSLWTIQREVQCYILLGMAGAVGLLKRNRTLLAIFFCSLMLHLALPSSWLPQIEDSRPLMVSFFAGVVLYIFRDRVFLSWIFVLLSILITLFIDRGPFQSLVAQLSVAYLALVSAILVPSSWKRLSYLMPDYSFGIYIYAFFIQQALVATGVADTPYANMCLTLILTLPFAALSWHYVEKPALALKAPGGQRVEVADRAPSG
jgi:peptidoglycan/LPS O-acetylase OafA/YrhL